MLKLLIFFFSTVLLVLLISCGVKNDPINPNKHVYPSVVDEIDKKIKNNYYGDTEFDSSFR